MTDAYAPELPGTPYAQQHAIPELVPAPQIWNLTQVTPEGTVQVQEAPHLL